MKIEFFKSSKGYICARNENGTLIFISDAVKAAIAEKGLKTLKGKLMVGHTEDGELRIQMIPTIVDSYGTMEL